MAITNHERVGKALELLRSGLGPLVEREFKNAYRDRAAVEVGRFMGEDRLNAKGPVADWDLAALLKRRRLPGARLGRAAAHRRLGARGRRGREDENGAPV